MSTQNPQKVGNYTRIRNPDSGIVFEAFDLIKDHKGVSSVVVGYIIV